MPAEPSTDDRVAELVRWAVTRGLIRGADGPPTAQVLSDSRDQLVVRVGAVVLKAHRPDTDAGALAARVRMAADPSMRDVLLAPLSAAAPNGPAAPAVVGGRLVTAWPWGAPLDETMLADAPWETAAGLLARLHAAPLPAGFPVAGAPAQVARAVARLRSVAAGTPAAEVVGRAYAALPASTRTPAAGPRTAMVHGDWHLGQIIRVTDGWRLIDVDDLGAGDPAWDLARPAAFFAAGLLTPTEWRRFLDAYGAAHGSAVPGDGDPWPALDAPARAMAVQAAAAAVAEATTAGRTLDPVATALVDCCARIAGARRAAGLANARYPATGTDRGVDAPARKDSP